jgi:uncharacterized protein (AIM24 family)
VNNFIAKEDNCTLGLTENMLGDIEVINVNEEFIVQSGTYVASTDDLTLDTKAVIHKRDFWKQSIHAKNTR